MRSSVPNEIVVNYKLRTTFVITLTQWPFNFFFGEGILEDIGTDNARKITNRFGW